MEYNIQEAMESSDIATATGEVRLSVAYLEQVMLLYLTMEQLFFRSLMQRSQALSTAEAKYVALSVAT